MTGPEHYTEAERLLALDHSYEVQGMPGRYGTAGPSEKDVAAAQVHATLALAAAMGTFGSLEDGGAQRSPSDDKAWRAVTSGTPKDVIS